ncbi:unnamed protein product [Dovyalis caffra]|uniref:Uncharacterized protein n=1 Tax=Dovyalis caffra TaxID=77055 RepID=A0AAV1RB66_9ROSI|nr:unnamed protein product [Dovyalis caffra]
MSDDIIAKTIIKIPKVHVLGQAAVRCMSSSLFVKIGRSSTYPAKHAMHIAPKIGSVHPLRANGHFGRNIGDPTTEEANVILKEQES